MSEFNYNFFVIAAVIAAKLDKATKVAKNLSLTASNARAIALRAGEGAAGFRPLTDFIDRLANMTISSSLQINKLAASLSHTAANRFRADDTIARFELIYQKSADSPYLDSLDFGYNRIKNYQAALDLSYQKQLSQLFLELEALQDELRTAVILATLSRVEASQAGSQYREALNNVANNVENSSKIIKKHIKTSLQLVAGLRQD